MVLVGTVHAARNDDRRLKHHSIIPTHETQAREESAEQRTCLYLSTLKPPDQPSAERSDLCAGLLGAEAECTREESQGSRVCRFM